MRWTRNAMVVIFASAAAFIIALNGDASYSSAPEAKARVILSRLYRSTGAMDIDDFSAAFFLRKNPDPRGLETTDEDDLVPFSKGRLYFKKPNKLRIELNLLYPQGMETEDFIQIRDGKFITQYKNGVDTPLAQDIDPLSPPLSLPYGLQLPISPSHLDVTLLGESQSLGNQTYVLGLSDRTDPKRTLIKLWVDSKRYVPVKTEQPDHHNSDITVTTLYKNAILLPDGHWLPMRTEQYINARKRSQPGTLAALVVYSDARFNNNLSDAIFQNPDPYKLLMQSGLSP